MALPRVLSSGSLVPPHQPHAIFGTRAEYTPHGSLIRTSHTHPINVSWIIPPELLLAPRDPTSSQEDIIAKLKATSSDLLDYINGNGRDEGNNLTRGSFGTVPVVEENGFGSQPTLASADPILALNAANNNALPDFLHGNMCLSSCPGKKVRINEQIPSGRPAISRDLPSDLGRIRGLGVTCIVNCLNDAELSFLGAPWKEYAKEAEKLGIEVLRYPIIEGAAPTSMSTTHTLIQTIDQRIAQGQHVLIHCRGGIGRAGLLACCWLLYRGYVQNGDRSIKLMRQRRSPKAIETQNQEDFIRTYAKFLKDQVN